MFTEYARPNAQSVVIMMCYLAGAYYVQPELWNLHLHAHSIAAQHNVRCEIHIPKPIKGESRSFRTPSAEPDCIYAVPK